MRVVVLCNPRLSRFDLAVLNNIRLRPELQVVGMVINSRKQLSAFQRVRRELRKAGVDMLWCRSPGSYSIESGLSRSSRLTSARPMEYLLYSLKIFTTSKRLHGSIQGTRKSYYFVDSVSSRSQYYLLHL